MINQTDIMNRVNSVFDDLEHVLRTLKLNVKAEINRDDPDAPMIDMDGLYLIPEIKLVQGPHGEVPAIVWGITEYKNIPGRFNPYDGGDPPETVEKELETDIENESDVIRKAVMLWSIKDIDEVLMDKEMADVRRAEDTEHYQD